MLNQRLTLLSLSDVPGHDITTSLTFYLIKKNLILKMCGDVTVHGVRRQRRRLVGSCNSFSAAFAPCGSPELAKIKMVEKNKQTREKLQICSAAVRLHGLSLTHASCVKVKSAQPS